jgi:hypothetical protein
MNIRLDSITSGIVESSYLDNPMLRYNVNIEENPHFLDDYDDVDLGTYDTWERMKKFAPVKGSTVGESPLIPLEDND